MYELRLIVRKAIRLLEEKVRFEHGFPSVIQRDGWGRTCLQKACENIREWSDGEVKYRYKMFHERFTADDEYVGEISTLVSFVIRRKRRLTHCCELDPRISLLRGATKAAAVINARNGYDLGKGNTQELIQELLQSKHYIYPPTPNVSLFSLFSVHDSPSLRAKAINERSHSSTMRLSERFAMTFSAVPIQLSTCFRTISS